MYEQTLPSIAIVYYIDVFALQKYLQISHWPSNVNDIPWRVLCTLLSLKKTHHTHQRCHYHLSFCITNLENCGLKHVGVSLCCPMKIMIISFMLKIVLHFGCYPCWSNHIQEWYCCSISGLGLCLIKHDTWHAASSHETSAWHLANWAWPFQYTVRHWNKLAVILQTKVL